MSASHPDSPSSFVLSAYRAILDLPSENILGVGDYIPIPDFPANILSNLCDEAIEVFKQEPMVVELQSPQYIVGDLHGSLHDLLRILKIADPFSNNFLFLGDYVDRGQFSTEVITILLALKCQKAKITLIRGNHEFEEVCSIYGFKNEILHLFGSEALFHKYLKVFSYLPIAATIDNISFCVHGGISQHLHNINALKTVQRPLTDSSMPLIHDIMWSDPSSVFSMYSESTRGDCYTFGYEAVRKFSSETNFHLIIRAHQYVEDGFKIELDNTVITIFSASSYKFDRSNKSAVIRFNGKSVDKLIFDPYPRLMRESAMFFTMKSPNKTKIINKSSSITFMTRIAPSGSMKNLIGKMGNRKLAGRIGMNHIPNSNSAASMNTFVNTPTSGQKPFQIPKNLMTFCFQENDENC
ncbi:Serine/threonine-protein phosphatase PP2A catalytic subunit [Tritrichomonas foetus]|uniref:Serine/threonine-protein phosphatase n=1 Tax=Tritrichomonas foetus TaxID=1144522 RepID=A0A1J4JSN2_9EUKA|nr:Serine/threonine-protein phosphatase PP2A catalytic subunit [Tritrichomonas foetus]|eukprot:OHT01770.1 Serine/threonine-protein phosphatase PP2A catalytic subunit [Tritrichomonas foetus]